MASSINAHRSIFAATRIVSFSPRTLKRPNFVSFFGLGSHASVAKNAFALSTWWSSSYVQEFTRIGERGWGQKPFCHLGAVAPRNVHGERLIESLFIGLEDVESTLNKGKERVLEDLRNNKHYSLITDTIQEMEWWACFQPEDRPSRMTPPKMRVPKTMPDMPLLSPMPVVQTATKKTKSRAKDKAKRKQAKASRRKKRR